MRPVNFTSHNHLRLLCCGAEFFPALMAVIDAAKNEIFLETYIFASDPTGQSIQAALIRAAARGVAVNVITDWLGTGQAQVKLLSHEFLAAGVNYRVFNPWFRRGVTRSHRKICVVDKEFALVGGLNVNDDLHCDFDYRLLLPAPRWDFAVHVAGPLVGIIHQEAQAQWARLGRLNLISRIGLYREMRSRLPSTPGKPALAALVVRDNLRNRRTIQRAYLQALGAAHKSVLMANPYFAPGRKFRNALAQAAARGVEVTLLIGAGQFRLQDAVAHSFYPKLIKSGVKLVEYHKTQLHAKVAVVDDQWATVGSSNCDGLSLFLNQEANVVVRDATFSKALRLQIERGVADGIPVNPADFANIPWYKRIWYEVAYLIYKGIMHIVTLGHYT